MVHETTELPRGGRVQEFLEAHRHALERALVARFGVEVGQDAAADAVSYCFEHWSRLADMENPVGYLFRVAQTSARRQRRWSRTDLMRPDPVSTDQPVNIDLQRALMKLRPEQRVAVLLTRGFGHSHSEVAEIMECTPSSVGNHVSRGLANLRKLMDP